MGVTDKHATMDEAGHWPAELRFPKIHVRKTRRRQSPSREVSPVPSYYSEPVSLRQRRDVTGRLPPFIRGANPEEEDDEEDAQSLKSLPTVMNTLTFDPKVKRSHRIPKAQIISDLNLPPLVTCNLVVKGTACSRVREFLPAIKSKRSREHKMMERPPCRAGRRPEKAEMATRQLKLVSQSQKGMVCESLCSEKILNMSMSCRFLPSTLASEASSRSLVTFRSLLAQTSVPVPSKTIKGTRPIPKKYRVPNGGTLECLHEESCLPCPGEPHLLEPLSGFQEHLRRQILNSPLPRIAALPQPPSCFLMHHGTSFPSPHDLYGSPVDRTVELCHSQGKRLPRITMTCPTPSPKHLRHAENRHMA